MKAVLLLIGILLVSACASNAKNSTKELTPEGVVGTYEMKSLIDGKEGVHKEVFLKNGTVETYNNGKKSDVFKWKIIGKEIHIEWQKNIEFGVFKKVPNGDITHIAIIHTGKRTDITENEHGETLLKK